MSLRPCKIFSTWELVWQAALKKTEVVLELLIDIDRLLMIEKRIIGVMCHCINRYVKANNKQMKDYGKNNHTLNIGM